MVLCFQHLHVVTGSSQSEQRCTIINQVWFRAFPYLSICLLHSPCITEHIQGFLKPKKKKRTCQTSSFPVVTPQLFLTGDHDICIPSAFLHQVQQRVCKMETSNLSKIPIYIHPWAIQVFIFDTGKSEAQYYISLKKALKFLNECCIRGIENIINAFSSEQLWIVFHF